MHRIDADDAAGLFKKTPAPATVVTAEWANDMQENMARLIEAFGVALVKGDFDQLTAVFASIGLPGRADTTDLDALNLSGFFASSAAATGRPAGAAAGNVLSMFDQAAAGDGLQLFFEQAADGVWFRRWDGAAWADWVEVYTSASAGTLIPKAVCAFTGQAFNGACGLGVAANIASVSRTATGEYDVLFTTPLAHANYAVVQGSGEQNVVGNYHSRTVNGFSLSFQNGNANVGSGPNDPASASFTVYA